MPKVKLDGYECERCGHTWVPRTKIEESPTICPKCKSPYWNKPRLTRSRKIVAGVIIVAALIAGSFMTPQMQAFAANTIGSLDIIDGSIKAVDVSNAAITKDKIATGAVSNQKIANEAVTNGKIAPNAVTSTRIMDDTINAADLKEDSVGASELQGVSKLIIMSCHHGGYPDFGCAYDDNTSDTSVYLEAVELVVPGASSGDRAMVSIDEYRHLCSTCTIQVMKAWVAPASESYSNWTEYTGDTVHVELMVDNPTGDYEKVWSIDFNVIVFAN